MTFLDLQDRILDRLNLSTDDARNRIKNFINERLRRLQTSVNLSRVRRGTIIVQTVADTASYALIGSTPSGVACIKPFTITIPDTRHPLGEVTVDQLRNRLTTTTAKPEVWATKLFEGVQTTIEVAPVPDGVYDLTIDGMLQGLDLSADDDVPALPEDFHDILIFGALEDEYNHFDNAQLAGVHNGNYERRLSELRYFIQKSIYQARVQNGRASTPTFWWRVP